MSHEALRPEWSSINFAMQNVATVTNADAVINALAPSARARVRREETHGNRQFLDNRDRSLFTVCSC